MAAISELGPQLEGLRNLRMDHSLRRELDQIHEIVGEIREVENKCSQALTLLDHRTSSMQSVLGKLEALVRGNGMTGLLALVSEHTRRINDIEEDFDKSAFKFETRAREIGKILIQVIATSGIVIAAMFAAGKM